MKSHLRFVLGVTLALVFAPSTLANPAVWERFATDAFVRGGRKR